MVQFINYKINFYVIIAYFIHVYSKEMTNICFDIRTQDLSLKLEINDLDTEEISFKIDLKVNTRIEPKLKFQKCIEKSNKETPLINSTKTIDITKNLNNEFRCFKKYENDVCLTKQILMKFINDKLKQEEIKLIGKKIVVKII